MKSKIYQSIFGALVILAALGLLAVGCFGSGAAQDGVTPNVAQARVSTTTATSEGDGMAATADEEYSTFKAKDPFIQQGVEVSTTNPSAPTSTTGGGQPNNSTTTTRQPSFTTTTYHGGGGSSGTTTTTKPKPTTTTTAPHLHTLKILSVQTVGGAAAATFQVDSSVYKDKKVGDVVSTSWGQIKVLDISTSSKVVTLLQGSETLVLSVGQAVHE